MYLFLYIGLFVALLVLPSILILVNYKSKIKCYILIICMRQNNCFPLISVLIPVYNAELFLVECLDGILSQTYPNLEIICLDDASTDGSFRLLTDYAAKDPRIKLIKQEQHHGIAVARNTLLRHISGEYFAFVDADDLIDPAYVENLYQTASRTGADITRGLYNILYIPHLPLV